jgi:hypothetical protein
MKQLLFPIIAAFLLVFVACDKDEDTARVSIYLTDGPADYDAIFIEVESVEVHVGNDTSGNSGWHSLPVTPGVFNLLELANGLDTLLGTAAIPAGRLTQIRLLLGNENTIVVDSVEHDLQTVANNKLKLNINQDIVAGGDYTFLLDFDAGKSIVETGNGQYKLKPVIKVVDASTSGAIKGYIDPASCHSHLVAINGQDTATTFAQQQTGYFLIQGLPAGTYELRIDAATPCTDKVIPGVQVQTGEVTDLGKIQL